MHDIMPAQPPRHPYPWHTRPRARAQRQPRAVGACWKCFMPATGSAGGSNQVTVTRLSVRPNTYGKII
jgi:hypothetical protein